MPRTRKASKKRKYSSSNMNIIDLTNSPPVNKSSHIDCVDLTEPPNSPSTSVSSRTSSRKSQSNAPGPLRKSPRLNSTPKVNTQYQDLINRIKSNTSIRTIGHYDVPRKLMHTNISLTKGVDITSINAFLAELPSYQNIVLLSMQNLFIDPTTNGYSDQVFNQLIRILPSTSIIKLNIGEYFPSNEVIANFIDMLPNTLVGFIYLTEVILTNEQKIRIIEIIQTNRRKDEFYKIYYDNYQYVFNYKKSFWDDPNGTVYERARLKFGVL